MTKSLKDFPTGKVLDQGPKEERLKMIVAAMNLPDCVLCTREGYSFLLFDNGDRYYILADDMRALVEFEIIEFRAVH